MKKQFKIGIIATIIALAFNSTYAQVPVQWSRTLQLEGYWEGPAVLNLGGQIFNVANYHVDFKAAIDGNVLTMDEGFIDAALGELKGANLIGYSPYDDKIHWFSADNFGTAHEHVGSWLTPKRFHMEHHSMQDGLPFAEYIDIRLRANDQKVLLALIATLGQDTVQIVTATFFRQSNGSRLTNLNSDNSEIAVYPKPSDGRLTIESAEIIDEVKITNEMGQIVCKANPNETDYSLQLENAGIYFVQVTSGSKSETKKVYLTK